jgi:hypothetical protein
MVISLIAAMATYPTLWVQLDDGIFEETLEAGQEISLR